MQPLCIPIWETKKLLVVRMSRPIVCRWFKMRKNMELNPALAIIRQRLKQCVKRYQQYKEDGLKDLSRKKHTVQSRLIKKQNCRLLNAVKLIQVGMPEESKKYWNSTTPMSLSIE